VAANRPARARLLAVAPAGRSAASYTITRDTTKFGGMDVSDARRLKALEDENSRLKKLLAEAMLDNAMLKDIAAKKW
jgi:putative transposase